MSYMMELIIIAGVILAAAVFIGILTDAKNNPVKFYKNDFFMLKDKINNIYIYVYEYRNAGIIYINNDNGFIPKQLYFVKNYFFCFYYLWGLAPTPPVLLLAQRTKKTAFLV